MSSRERILAISVGGTLVLLVLLWGWSKIDAMYTFRRAEIGRLESALKEQRKLEMQTLAAQSRMRNYEERSLPPVPSVARTAYLSWLLDLVEKAGMGQPTPTMGRGKDERNLFSSQVFTLQGKGTLPQVVKFLHGFYSADYLHRITKLTLEPIKGSKELDYTVDVDAMSLERAAPTATVKERKSDRLALPKQEDYVRIISERNLFGPPNHAPKVLGLGNQKAIRGRSVDIAARGDDPDKLDKLTYKMVKSGATDARLDPTTGKLSWTPRTNGKYEFLVQATDDGWPAKASKEELLVVTVEDPPPPPPEPPKKLAFDEAKHTVLTAVIDVSGTGQIWLSNRPKGETLKLGVGDKFEVGSVKGVVTSIGDGDFTFESDGKERKLLKGSNLGEAVLVPQ
ncbi:MAG: cadherin repeat domain-containing protein [Planctomycetales bacterium]|nr:cadherin repeat domain-containing protein [Planctomycetales bacterium]